MSTDKEPKSGMAAAFYDKARTIDDLLDCEEGLTKLGRRTLGTLRDWMIERAGIYQKRSDAGSNGANARWERAISNSEDANGEKEFANGKTDFANGKPIAKGDFANSLVSKGSEGKVREGKESKEGQDKPGPSPLDLELSQVFRAGVLKCLPSAKVPDETKLEKWADEFRKIREIDKRPIESIRAILEWIPKDPPNGTWPGWGSVCLSPAKLRLKWDPVSTAYQRRNQTAKGTNPAHQKPAPQTKTIQDKTTNVIAASHGQDEGGTW